MHDIYQMWYLADQDLLSSYHVLRDTGQGLNRVQKCPSIGRAMTNVISRAQGRLGGGWVGSSVVHLGDHNGTFPRSLLISGRLLLSSLFVSNSRFASSLFAVRMRRY
jgi:hypothetical protein